MAAGLVIALGLAIVIASVPFLMGLLGAPLLAVVFAPVHRRLVRHLTPRWSAAVVLVLSVVAVLLPAVLVITLIVNEAPQALSGPGTQQLITDIGALRIGSVVVGPELAKASSDIVSWLSREMVVVAGGVTRIAVNLLIAFLGLYYLLLSGEAVWRSAAEFVPFSGATMERLRDRFAGVTRATLLGIGLTALLQGTIVGGAFAIVGLEHPLLWGVLIGPLALAYFFELVQAFQHEYRAGATDGSGNVEGRGVFVQ
jgi:predicted PurR-regulated permease PerM